MYNIIVIVWYRWTCRL